MKFSQALAFMAVTAPVAVVAQNAVFPGLYADISWCCNDARPDQDPNQPSYCPDACALIEDPEFLAKYAPGPPVTDFIGTEVGTEFEVEGIPEGGFTDIAIVQMKCRMLHGLQCCGQAGVCGDPHFQMWNGKMYDYQGQGELKFVSAPDFGNGVGMDIHIRTKIRYSYSYIESAAIKIGDDVLEIGSYGEYFLNGVEGAELPATLGGAFPVAYFERSEKEHVFDIFIGGDRRIVIKNLKDWVSIKIENPTVEDFTTSVGMMGDFHGAGLLGRDGITVFKEGEENAFGQEWQIRSDEPQLFQRKNFEPQYPAKCILPVIDEEATQAQQRRLAESGITQEKAAEACAGHPAHKEFCIADVLATGDLDIAGAF